MQCWLRRAGNRPLAEVDWSDRSRRPHRLASRTRPEVEQAILAWRRRLKQNSPLGFYGAEAIRDALQQEQPLTPVPHVRTIGRILARNGVLDGRRPPRRPAPPPGWYLPDVALGEAELESFDAIEGLRFEDGVEFDVLTGRSLWGPHAVAWPVPALSARLAVKQLLGHWRAQGLPAYAQFDNGARFAGPVHLPGVVGLVARLCLSTGVVPVFVPQRETGFQAAAESFNWVWKTKVWARFGSEGMPALAGASARFITAYVRRRSARIEQAPPRRALAGEREPDLQVPAAGRIIYLRRTDERGRAFFLGRQFEIDDQWLYRLVRCEFDIARGEIACYRLRRSAPQEQPFIRTIEYRLPIRGRKQGGQAPP